MLIKLSDCSALAVVIVGSFIRSNRSAAWSEKSDDE